MSGVVRPNQRPTKSQPRKPGIGTYGYTVQEFNLNTARTDFHIAIPGKFWSFMVRIRAGASDVSVNGAIYDLDLRLRLGSLTAGEIRVPCFGIVFNPATDADRVKDIFITHAASNINYQIIVVSSNVFSMIFSNPDIGGRRQKVEGVVSPDAVWTGNPIVISGVDPSGLNRELQTHNTGVLSVHQEGRSGGSRGSGVAIAVSTELIPIMGVNLEPRDIYLINVTSSGLAWAALGIAAITNQGIYIPSILDSGGPIIIRNVNHALNIIRGTTDQTIAFQVVSN